MPEKRIHHPHDKLLKDTFSSPQNASAFFQHHLPSPLSATFDWSTLHLEPCSFILKTGMSLHG
jgi:predicted transposase YdaD